MIINIDWIVNRYNFVFRRLQGSVFNFCVFIHRWIEYFKNETNWGKNIAQNSGNVIIPYQYEGEKFILYNKPGNSSPVLSAILEVSSSNEDITNEFLLFFRNLGVPSEKKPGIVSFDISKLVRSLAGPNGNFHGNKMTVKDFLFLIISETCYNIEYIDDNLEYCSVKLNIFTQELEKKEYDLNDFVIL